MRPGAMAFGSPDEAVEQITQVGGASVIGTPDDLVAAIRDIVEVTGGFGAVIGFAHDWANRPDTFASWELVARYVVPEVNRMLDGFRESQRHVIEHRDVFERAGQAVLSKIMQHERAAKAMAETTDSGSAMPAHHAPDLRGRDASGG
jgi:limonene 1,2-monooxygenase